MADTPQPVQISMHSIPVGRSLGAAVLIALILLGMFLDLPGIRPIVVWGFATGLVFAAVLIAWRRRRGAS